MPIEKIGALLLSVFFALSAHAGPRIETWETTHGARVLFVENHDLPILDVAVDVAAGAAFDAPGLEGRAGLVAGLLKLGSGGVAEDEVARRLADAGAQLGPRFDQDRAGLVLRTLTEPKYRKVALDVMANALARPDFPDAVLAREKVRAIAGIREAATRPAVIAEKAFSATVFGDHPYGAPATGTEESVAAVARDDLIAFHQTRYTAENTVVSLMGDVTRAEASEIAEALTAGLPTRAGVASLPVVDSLKQAVVKEIPHPSTQAHILMGQPGLKRGDPDYFPLYVGNYVLGGGGFDSRMLEEVRQKRGLAYNAYSYFLPLAESGPFQIGLQTRKDQAGKALEVVRETLARFVADGPTDAELTQAKNHLIGGFPLRLDSNKEILEYLSVIGFYRLPLSYIDDFTGHVDAVTREAVVDAFRRRVDPAHMATIVVGGTAAP